MTDCRSEALDRAIAERSTVNLLNPSDAEHPWQVRLLASADDGGEDEAGSVWAQPLDHGGATALEPFIASGDELHLSVARDRQRRFFRTQAVRRKKHYWVDEAMVVDAVLLAPPTEIAVEERRAHLRFSVPDGSSISAQLICPSAIFPLQARPWDLSEGGAAFLCPREQVLLGMSCGERMAFVISFQGRKVAGAAVLRFSKVLSSHAVRIGVQFDPASMDAISQENLKFLLDDLARLERLRGRGPGRVR